MGFLGDIGKGLAGTIRGGARFLGSEAGRVITPLVAGAIGGPGAAVATSGLIGVIAPQRTPTRRPTPVRRTPSAAVRRRISVPPRRRVPPIVTIGPPVPPSVPTPVARRVQPATARLRPARMQLRVPPALADPLTTLRRASPLGFAPGTVAGGRSTFGPITAISETVDKFGRPLVVEAKVEDRLRCPPGYLAITMPDGSRACALAGPAISAGLARRRRKPLISVKETRALQLAGRAQKKIDRVHKRFGTKRPTRRRAPRRS